MHFGDLGRGIALWVGSIATAYTLVFLNAVSRSSRGFGPLGTKVVLLAVALGALVFIIRHSKTQWGIIVGSLLVVLAASHVVRTPERVAVETDVTEPRAHYATFNVAVPFGCGDVDCAAR